MLDASAALAFALPSQASAGADAFFARQPLARLMAPAVFRLEVRNTLLRFERMGALTEAQSETVWGLIAAMVDVGAIAEFDRGFASILALARAESLSFFDACYLDLAIAQGVALASRDGPLLAAAQRRGVAVEDLR